LTTRVPAAAPEQRARGAELYVPDNGRFDGAAAPGVFQIRALQGEFAGRVIIDVGNRDLDVIVPLRPLTSVTGRVRVEDTVNDAVDLTGLQVAIRTAPTTQFVAPVASDGNFRIERVMAGDYRVYVPPLVPAPAVPVPARPELASPIATPTLAATLSPVLENAYVKTILAGRTDLINGLLRVEGVEPVDSFEIVLGLRGASIEGRALNARQEPVSLATVVLLPDGQPPFRPDRHKTFTTDESGRFQFRGLPPGEYRLLAWEDVDPGAWFSTSFLSSYEGTAVQLRLTEGDRRALDVSVIPATP
jgi:hypothetical protein